MSDDGRFTKNNIPWNKGVSGVMPIPWDKGKKIDRDKYPNMGHFKKHTEETKKKMRIARLGKLPSNKGIPMKEESKKRMIQTLKDNYRNGKLTAWNKGRPNMKIRGKNHPGWKGGVTTMNERIRKSIEYKLWRTAVFIRDNYTCQVCGQVGKRLHADHIKPFSLFPELRFSIDNGRTLCKECHKETDSYGWNCVYLRRENFLNG